eukprot:TRINITY_DN7988_c0_g2_i1.p1 TRINITY_DN7988_c0_g2~~TRINITY_DN7988_c0_g2_i1.p1  ORF type:complete len:644 (+),score=120.06 TRINITY_DN7988_c0_g2_i1:1696-3627(+)
MSIKAIIKQNPAGHEKVIVQLARILDAIKVPAARAAIIWIVGEYSSMGQIIPRIVPTVLQYLARCFISEEQDTKHQILNATAKVVLCARGEHLLTFKRLLTYVLELAKCDLNYDVRDRARVISRLLSFHLASECQGEANSHIQKNPDVQHELAEKLFIGKAKSALHTNNNFRFYLPGSLSHIVFHAAPGYEPLPKPCSLPYDDLQSSELVPGKETLGQKTTNSDSGTNDPDTLSGSSNEESASAYNSEHYIDSSAESDGTGSASDACDNGNNNPLLAGHVTEDDDTRAPLIHLSDAGVDYTKPNEGTGENSSVSLVAELMSKKALESWLDEQPGFLEMGSSQQRAAQSSSARISLRDCAIGVKPKIHVLLDPANGNGLKVDYSFSSEISSISKLMVCVDIFFENCSMEPLTKIAVKDEESDGTPESAKQAPETYESSVIPRDVPTLIPVEEIASLEPGQTAKQILQVRFHHHLLPLKLAVFCHGKKYPVKLRPDIGYFIKPLSLVLDVFMDKELQLRGMFEYTRRCTFTDHIMDLKDEKDHGSFNEDKFLMVCRSLASKMLSNANVFLVSIDMPVTSSFDDATGLCLRFCCEMLSSSIPCLITITIEGKCSEPLNVVVKVNCEETVFGLNLLNRVVTFLSLTS